MSYGHTKKQKISCCKPDCPNRTPTCKFDGTCWDYAIEAAFRNAHREENNKRLDAYYDTKNMRRKNMQKTSTATVKDYNTKRGCTSTAYQYSARYRHY